MRLIDKDALIKKLESNSWTIDEWELPFDHVTAGLRANAMDRETVEGMPTVDAVPVIRCKDCKHWQCDDSDTYCNELGIYNTDMNSYCSYAKRKEHETD